MAARNFTAEQDKEGTYLLEGELSIHDLDEIRSFLEEALQGTGEACLSLAKVRFLDMAALQLLIAFKKRSEPAARLRVCAVSPEVNHLLSLCGLRTALL
jgi:anti-anti-sigma factor